MSIVAELLERHGPAGRSYAGGIFVVLNFEFHSFSPPLFGYTLYTLYVYKLFEGMRGIIKCLSVNVKEFYYYLCSVAYVFNSLVIANPY